MDFRSSKAGLSVKPTKPELKKLTDAAGVLRVLASVSGSWSEPATAALGAISDVLLIILPQED